MANHQALNTPRIPYLAWEGVLTPEARAFIAQGNGPWWQEGDHLVLSQDPEGEDGLRVRPGEYVSYLGAENGFEAGLVVPVFMHVGWDNPSYLVGWVLAPEDMPGLLRRLADEWKGGDLGMQG